MELGDIEKYKNTILNTAVIILAVIIAANIYKNHAVSINMLNSQKQEEIEKNEITADIIKLQKDFNGYKNLINNKDVSQAINDINVIAKNAGVKIISIKPEQPKREGIFENFPFQVAISARSYEDAGNFISSLETDPRIFIIDSIDFKPQKEGIEKEAVRRKKVSKGLSINLKITTNLIK